MLLIEPLEWKQISDEIKQRYGNFSPHTVKERFMWVPISMVVAVSEEILYRAVFFGIFYQITDNYWVAGLISAVLFAGAHWKYGLTALPTAFFVAIGLQYIVNISGGLYVAIAVHFIHNLVNGIVYGWIWKRKLEIAEEMIPGDIEVVAQVPELD
jgi:membrane protease YdiL (CAAX protease family)